MKRQWYTLSLAACVLVMAFSTALLCAATTRPPATTRAATARAPANSTQPSDSNKLARPTNYAACEKRVADIKEKPCDLIFIGDSITEGWNAVEGKETWDKFYGTRHALNFGIGSDRTEHVLWRLENMDVKNLTPKVAILLIGTNNTSNTPEQIAAGVKAVVGKTQATFKGVKIILMAILPNQRATQKMADANKLILPIADDKTIFYFDLGEKMPKEGDNWKGLKPDKLHLTAEGYALWATEMEPLLTKVLESH